VPCRFAPPLPRFSYPWAYTVVCVQARTDNSSQRFVRINSQKLGLDDLEVLVRCFLRLTTPMQADTQIRRQLTTPSLQGIVMPKVDSARDVQIVNQFIEKYGLDETKRSVRIIASIESPMALLNLREVNTAFPSESRRCKLINLIFVSLRLRQARLESLLFS